MKKVYIAAFIVIICFTGCTDKESTERALKAQGFSDVKIKGYSYFGCSRDDAFHTEFSAINPKGEKVEGVACSGILKNTTIRW